MTQSELTFALEALAIGSTGWLVVNFTVGLANLWKRCDPALVSKRSELRQPSKTLLPKLGNEQPVDLDPDFDIEFEDAEAIAAFANRFA
ncbi:MAG: hypothetical protein WBA10_11010 [Elainellaceae cyanobacterium]